jgi:hypothetical protein
MLHFRVAQTRSLGGLEYGPANVRNCGIIEGIIFEEDHEESIVGFRLGFSIEFGEFGLEVDRGAVCVKVFDFFKGIIGKYAIIVDGPKMESSLGREFLSVRWSIFDKLIQSIRIEEREKRIEEIKSKCAQDFSKVLNEIKLRFE